MPEGYKLTQTQLFISYTIILGTSLILLINAFFWLIYRWENPFIEQYKILKQPWPWKIDPEGWRI